MKTDTTVADLLVPELAHGAQTTRSLSQALAKKGNAVEKSQLNRVLYKDGRFEKKANAWSLRPRCLDECRALCRFRVGTTCVHLSGPIGTDALRGILQSLRLAEGERARLSVEPGTLGAQVQAAWDALP